MLISGRASGFRCSAETKRQAEWCCRFGFMVWARVLRVSNSTHQSADSRENPASRRESFLSESGRTRAIHCPMPLCTYVMLEVHPAIAKLVSVCMPRTLCALTRRRPHALHRAAAGRHRSERGISRAQPAWNGLITEVGCLVMGLRVLTSSRGLARRRRVCLQGRNFFFFARTLLFRRPGNNTYPKYC